MFSGVHSILKSTQRYYNDQENVWVMLPPLKCLFENGGNAHRMTFLRVKTPRNPNPTQLKRKKKSDKALKWNLKLAEKLSNEQST